ncbi:GntR family transcriptional regulator [Nocardiopsis sp. CT-R113]|uniref:GntR family transcriptional regulator n=1 Tax=Nocardiopsis codii TaxID=3065942 RepID=A0ABU7K7Y1_9ACTN|nr:GntR family transcriptional regulator [Nocardiopsis sp. CT-R113]MEE2038341.1 GntR family transcriptional regulator [Nocardiopsis sp. CT-R113]
MVGSRERERVAGELRRRIRAGDPGPGGRLPSEDELAGLHGADPAAVRGALALLRAEGLVGERDAPGTVVLAPRRAVVRSSERHQWEKDRARADLRERRATGATENDTGSVVDDLEFSARYGRVDADPDLADALGVPKGTALLERVYRTRHRDEDAPFSLTSSYLVLDLVESNPDLLDETREPWPGGTQSQLRTVGVEVDRVEERITARPPTPDEADGLGLGAGAAVMVLRKTSIDTRGRVVDWSEVILPGDRSEAVFTTRLERW